MHLFHRMCQIEFHGSSATDQDYSVSTFVYFSFQLAKHWCITEANWPKLTTSGSQCYNNIICNALPVTETDQLKLTTTETHCWFTDVCNISSRLCFAHGRLDEISAFTLYSEFVRPINIWSNLRMSIHCNTDYSRITLFCCSEFCCNFAMAWLFNDIEEYGVSASICW